MISVFTTESFDLAAPGGLRALLVEPWEVSQLLDVADFLGWQDDGQGGRFQLWNLRKPLGGHPTGSTLTRASVLALLRGQTVMPPVVPKEFEAIERDED